MMVVAVGFNSVAFAVADTVAVDVNVGVATAALAFTAF